ncbi:Hypothetical predicted protein [Mytilus galloprovincialis]|uniref:Uncharacterized protein n=1 Tax=Mytilus galloprovincialis TaxID=29158 RepID=A0A8B6CQS2_MYTGA|nr:Hypothetical predicted protein [Mytilus galloprovincialis]
MTRRLTNALWYPGYSIQLSRTFSSVDFECKNLSNNQYYLRGTSTFDVFSNIYRPHICLEFYNLTSDKYYYHVATDIQSAINDIIYIDKDVNLVTHGDVCNRQTPFEEGSYVMLIKYGASDTSLAVECPNDISKNFDNVKFSSSDGNYSCSGTLDTFTDRLKMNYTYNSCENRLTFSDDGVWRCLYNIHVDSTTYLAALNTDAVLVTGPTDTLVTENTTENTTQGPTDPPVTDNSPANTTQDYGLDMITLLAVNVTIEGKKHPGLRLDDDRRVEVGLYTP